MGHPFYRVTRFSFCKEKRRRLLAAVKGFGLDLFDYEFDFALVDIENRDGEIDRAVWIDLAGRWILGLVPKVGIGWHQIVVVVEFLSKDSIVIRGEVEGEAFGEEVTVAGIAFGVKEVLFLGET